MCLECLCSVYPAGNRLTSPFFLVGGGNVRCGSATCTIPANEPCGPDLQKQTLCPGAFELRDAARGYVATKV